MGDGEHQGQVAVDSIIILKNLGGFDALPCGGNLDQDSILRDSQFFVELSAISIDGLGVRIVRPTSIM